MRALATAIAAALAHLVVAAAPGPALAQAKGELVVKESKGTVAETIDRLAKAVEAAGAKVVARVDHAAAAKAAGLELRPTQVLIFGNPKAGTPLMQASQSAGLDLPLKMLAYADEKGKVWVVYANPEALKARHAIAGRDPVIKAIGETLQKLSDAAAGK